MLRFFDISFRHCQSFRCMQSHTPNQTCIIRYLKSYSSCYPNSACNFFITVSAFCNQAAQICKLPPCCKAVFKITICFSISVCYCNLLYSNVCPVSVLPVCRGVATGGISVYIPPNQSNLFFLCGCFVMILKLQWLVNIYTHPNQIPGYASAGLANKEIYIISLIVLSNSLNITEPSPTQFSGEFNTRPIHVCRHNSIFYSVNTVRPWIFLSQCFVAMLSDRWAARHSFLLRLTF